MSWDTRHLARRWRSLLERGLARVQEREPLLAAEQSRRVGRDNRISFQGKRPPVPSQYLGQRVWLQLLGDQTTITAHNRTIAHYSLANL